jgi:DNA-binding response OmpR family regulator
MKRIMIIEDETTLRDELSVLLKNAGYESVAVTDYLAN